MYHASGGADQARIRSDMEVFDARFVDWCSDQARIRSDTEVSDARF